MSLGTTHEVARRENALQPTSREAVRVSFVILGLSAWLFMLCASLTSPLPVNAWLDGTQIASLDRVQRGGRFYPEYDEGTLDATMPYFPGTLFILKATDSLIPQGRELAPRVCGVVSSFALLAAVFWYSVRLGSSWFLAFTFSLFCFTMLIYWKYQLVNFVPDYLLGALCLFAGALTASATVKIRSPLREIALAVILVACGLLKQGSVAVFVGSLATAVYSRIGICRKASLFSEILLAGVVVLGILLVTPNVFDTTIRGMRDHPRFTFHEFLSLNLNYVFHFWPVYVPVALFVIECCASARIRKTQNWTFVMPLVFLWLPLSLIQIASAFKIGGGTYNFDLVFLLLIPIALIGIRGALRPRWILPWHTRFSHLRGIRHIGYKDAKSNSAHAPANAASAA